ncbi:hypothetical protein LHJMPILO_02567 [Aeromonas veronii]
MPGSTPANKHRQRIGTRCIIAQHIATQATRRIFGDRTTLVVGGGRHIIFHVDGKTPCREATCQWVSVTIGGGQYAREVDAHACRLFTVITIRCRMVQLTTQGKAVAAASPYSQGKDRHTTRTGCQHIARHAVAQRHTATGQPLSHQTTDITAQTKAACPIGTKVDQRIKGASQPCCAHTLVSPFAVAAGQRIFVHQTAHELFLPTSQSGGVIQNGNVKGIAGRVPIAIDQYNAEAFA